MELGDVEKLVIRLSIYIGNLEMRVMEVTKMNGEISQELKDLSYRFAEMKGKLDGYERQRDQVLDTARSVQAKSLSGQRGGMDDRCGSYSNGGTAETEAWNVDNAAGS